SRSSNLEWRFNPLSRWRLAQRKHSGGAPTSAALLAERARDESVGGAAGAGAPAGKIDFRRADLGGGHVEALAGGEALGLAHGVGGGVAIGRAIGRQHAFLMARHHPRAGNAHDGIGGALGAVDGVPGLVAEFLDLLAGALEGRGNVAGLLGEPAADGIDKTAIGF